jgi:hypothetical protein
MPTIVTFPSSRRVREPAPQIVKVRTRAIEPEMRSTPVRVRIEELDPRTGKFRRVDDKVETIVIPRHPIVEV